MRLIWYFTNISGNPVANKTQFTGWQLWYDIQQHDGTITSGITPYSAGLFTLAPTGPPGYYAMIVSDSLIPDERLTSVHCALIPPTGDDVAFVTPDFYAIRDLNAAYDANLQIQLDSYAQLVLTSENTGYSNVLLRAKEGDDIVFVIQVPQRFRPLSGWTNISVQAFPRERSVDPTVAPIPGTYQAVVVDANAGLIRCRIGRDVTANKVPAGSDNTLIYADVQGDDPNGYHFTFVQCDINLIRNYNINNE